MPGLENFNGFLNRSVARELAIFLAERGPFAEAVSVLDEVLEHVKDVKDWENLEHMRARMAREVASS